MIFTDLPLTVAGAGVYSVAGRVGGSLLGQSLGTYLQGVILRGGTDSLMQNAFKGEIQWRQVTINATFGGGTGKAAISMGWANFGGNVFNNYYTSYESVNSVRGIYNDAPMNAAKVVTGMFGMGLGHLYSNYMGGVFLPSFYGTATDEIIENQ